MERITDDSIRFSRSGRRAPLVGYIGLMPGVITYDANARVGHRCHTSATVGVAADCIEYDEEIPEPFTCGDRGPNIRFRRRIGLRVDFS
jgi:hypothetical protein